LQILARGSADELVHVAEVAAGIDATIEQSSTSAWRATSAAFSRKAKEFGAPARLLQLAVFTAVQRKASHLLEAWPTNTFIMP
jgi:hypothetical protein